MSHRLKQGAMVLLAGAAMVGAAGLAGAEPIKPGQQQGLGLTGATVPDELKKISADPYAAPGDCTQINQEIAMLDDLLGPDRDSAAPEKPSTISTAVMPLARSFIPYRNVVRIVTGANQKDAELTQAAMAGWERRGFLKGLQKHCNAPDRADFVTGSPASAIAPEIRPEDLQVSAPDDRPSLDNFTFQPDGAPPPGEPTVGDPPMVATSDATPAPPEASAYPASYQSAAASDPSR